MAAGSGDSGPAARPGAAVQRIRARMCESTIDT